MFHMPRGLVLKRAVHLRIERMDELGCGCNTGGHEFSMKRPGCTRAGAEFVRARACRTMGDTQAERHLDARGLARRASAGP